MKYKIRFTRKPKLESENPPTTTSDETEQIQFPSTPERMNYLNLFQNTDMLDGGDNFCCCHFPFAGQTNPIDWSPYPMLFVLQGELNMRFKYHACRVTQENVIVVNAKAMTECHVAQDTIVLIYRPPLRLELMLSQCSQVFDTRFSDIVPILPPLWKWIDRLLTEHMQGKVWGDKEAHEQRKALAHIMMQEYPRRKLGELYAAFSACVVGNCEQCRQALDAQ